MTEDFVNDQRAKTGVILILRKGRGLRKAYERHGKQYLVGRAIRYHSFTAERYIVSYSRRISFQ